LAVPFGFEQIDLAPELEAAVDLFAAQPERLLGGQAEGVEQTLEEALKRIAARMRRQRRDLQQVRFDLGDRRALDGNKLEAYRGARRRGAARQAADQALVACLGIGDGVGAAGAG